MTMTESTSLVHDNTTNLPDYAAEEAARLAREFDNLMQEVNEAVDNAAAGAHGEINSQEDAEAFTTAITRLRDLATRVEAMREGEKLPHLRKGTAVDNFFNAMHDRLFKRKKTDPNGKGDELHAQLHAYNIRRQQEEQRRRDEVARREREAEETARRAREEAQRAEREAEQKAARARSDESRRRAEQEAADRRAETERLALVESQARTTRQEADANAKAKPADMVRERHAGALNTMRMVWRVTVEEPEALDVPALWPFIDDKSKQKAAEAWAKITNYKKPMFGLKIEQVPDTVVRR